MSVHIHQIGKLIGLTDDQITLVAAANQANFGMDGFYIPHTAKWQKIAKGLVLEGYLDVDHHSDDGQSIAVRFTSENAQNMVNAARQLTGS